MLTTGNVWECAGMCGNAAEQKTSTLPIIVPILDVLVRFDLQCVEFDVLKRVTTTLKCRPAFEI